MKIANNFQELGAQTAEWFGLGFNACKNNKFIDIEGCMESESILKKETQKLFNFLTENRYQDYPDQDAEDWLKEKDYKHGAIGYILDVNYIESDETSLQQFPVTYREMPATHPEDTEKVIAETIYEISQVLNQAEVPSSIIFGEMNSNNEFNKARKESNKDGFVVFAKDYMETLV
jgi:hypothetical protein